MTVLKAGDRYVCAGCARTFLTTRDDAEAYAELDRQFPGCDHNDAVRICDDCFNVASARIKAMVGDLVSKH